jgi:glutaredoxin
MPCCGTRDWWTPEAALGKIAVQAQLSTQVSGMFERPTMLLRPLVAMGALALLATPALALYKVVQPDGSVTYTDRPPSDNTARITPLNRPSTGATGASAPAAAGNLPPLPAELRQAVQRYPVTLYAAPDCAPCSEGRALLQQRGIPYTERRIETAEDLAAFERLTGARTVPALAIGNQWQRGFSSHWAAFLEAAGYPRESRLPRNWPAATVSPLAPRAPAAAPAPPPPPPPAPEPPAESEEPPATRIRF